MKIDAEQTAFSKMPRSRKSSGSDLNRLALMCRVLKRGGGAERVVCDLALGMKKRGLNVVVISVEGGDLEGELKQADIPIHILSKQDGSSYRASLINSLAEAFRMAIILRSNKIQAVNVHALGSERIACLAAKLAGTPLRTFVFHSNSPLLDPICGDEKLKKRLAKDLASFHHSIAITEKIRQSLIEASIVPAERLTVINNGVCINMAEPRLSRESVRSLLGLKNNDTVLIQVGRFHIPKNQDITVRAMKRIVAQIPDVHLLFVGIGPDFDKTKDLTEKMGLLSNIHFLGLRSDVQDLLGASDLCLLPSSWEGLPLVLLEAFSHSLPLIGCDVLGISDTVELDPTCAKLVGIRDEKALANAVLAAIGDADWRTQAGKSALGIVSAHFGYDKMVDGYIELHKHLFEQLCKDASKGIWEKNE